MMNLAEVFGDEYTFLCWVGLWIVNIRAIDESR
jgi:hypothetical protein